MKKSIITIDIMKKTIFVNSEFIKRCKDINSTEYADLQKAKLDNPKFKVEQKTIRRNSSKECYNGLTYDYMIQYIASHDEGDAIMKEFEELRMISKCHSVRYPTIKQWFLETYPKIKEFGLPKEEENAKISDIRPNMSIFKANEERTSA